MERASWLQVREGAPAGSTVGPESGAHNGEVVGDSVEGYVDKSHALEMGRRSRLTLSGDRGLTGDPARLIHSRPYPTGHRPFTLLQAKAKTLTLCGEGG